MPKGKKAIRPVYVKISFPENLYAQLMLHLFSNLEGRVPHGALSSFVQEAVKAKLKSEGMKDEN